MSLLDKDTKWMENLCYWIYSLISGYFAFSFGRWRNKKNDNDCNCSDLSSIKLDFFGKSSKKVRRLRHIKTIPGVSS